MFHEKGFQFRDSSTNGLCQNNITVRLHPPIWRRLSANDDLYHHVFYVDGVLTKTNRWERKGDPRILFIYTNIVL